MNNKFPVIRLQDLIKAVKSSRIVISREIKTLTKANLVKSENRVGTLIVWLTRKGIKSFKKWEKEEGQALKKQITQT